MAKATLKERIRSIQQKSDAGSHTSFMDAPFRQTAPPHPTCSRAPSMSKLGRSGAVVATNVSRLLDICDYDLCRDVLVEEP
jgi:hypothetical protein